MLEIYNIFISIGVIHVYWNLFDGLHFLSQLFIVRICMVGYYTLPKNPGFTQKIFVTLLLMVSCSFHEIEIKDTDLIIFSYFTS